jgi:hypothetical protein
MLAPVTAGIEKGGGDGALDSLIQVHDIFVEYKRRLEVAYVEPQLCLHNVETMICKEFIMLADVAVEAF